MSKSLEIELRVPNNLEPTFANMVDVIHKDGEFTLQFSHAHLLMKNGKPIGIKAVVKVIVTMTPAHTKRMLNVLCRNIQKYEQKFGEIKLLEEPKKQSFKPV